MPPVGNLVVDVVQRDGAEKLWETIHLEELVRQCFQGLENFRVMSFFLLYLRQDLLLDVFWDVDEILVVAACA